MTPIDVNEHETEGGSVTEVLPKTGLEAAPDTVSDIPDDQLLERAVKSARPRKGRVPRWAAVSDTFALGSTFSIQLCLRFGLDPDQQIGRSGIVRCAQR